MQGSSSLQTLVAQRLICGVTSRGVQSHFDPVPASARVWQEFLWFEFCSQTRQEGINKQELTPGPHCVPLTILHLTEALTVQLTGPAVELRSPHVSGVLGVFE